ncbi:hypothetical protein CUMW_036780 [Citrus unshiu]|nr:hypothetical protein CUMW_036780 [Citrus unshiu]
MTASRCRCLFCMRSHSHSGVRASFCHGRCTCLLFFADPSSLFLLNWASACGPSSLSFDFIWTWHSLD